MSKMDDLRAMREARYQAMASRSTTPATPARTVAASAPEASPSDPAVESTPARCGHRNMGGKTCVREQGHVAKSHRYS